MSNHRAERRLCTALVVCGTLLGASCPASALVRFGNNVFIGGHDFSHQTYDRTHRAIVHLYNRTPPGAGCRWRPDGHGGRVKICHLGRIRPR